MTDLISRQAAIDALVTPRVHDVYDSYWDGRNTQYQEDIDAINALPSVQPEQKKGKWIDEGQYAEGHSEHAYYCSQCEEHYIGWIGEFNFCPNCGAKMEVEQE